MQPRRQVPRDQATTSQPCKPGMESMRNRGCLDIDECQKYPDACRSNEECKKTPGSFICECKFGFQRNNITLACVDINECQLRIDNCSEAQTCANIVGSFMCMRKQGCGTGYTLTADTDTCEDNDECALGTHDCQSGYRCRNTRGSYRCDRISRFTPGPRISPVVPKFVVTTPIAPAVQSHVKECSHGFEIGENGQCLDVDECQRSPNPCAGSSLQKCINTVGSFRYFFHIFYEFILRIKCI